MANIYFKCSCQKHLAVDESGAGRTVKCIDCGKPITVPEPEMKMHCVCGKPMWVPEIMAGESIQCVDCNEFVEIPAIPGKTLRITFEDIPETPQCPSCGVPIKSNRVLCVNCGLNFKTGKKITTDHKGLDQSHRQPFATRIDAIDPEQQSISTRKTVACPFCGESILSIAIKCKHCGEFLDGRKKLI